MAFPFCDPNACIACSPVWNRQTQQCYKYNVYSSKLISRCPCSRQSLLVLANANEQLLYQRSTSPPSWLLHEGLPALVYGVHPLVHRVLVVEADLQPGRPQQGPIWSHRARSWGFRMEHLRPLRAIVLHKHHRWRSTGCELHRRVSLHQQAVDADRERVGGRHVHGSLKHEYLMNVRVRGGVLAENQSNRSQHQPHLS